MKNFIMLILFIFFAFSVYGQNISDTSQKQDNNTLLDNNTIIDNNIENNDNVSKESIAEEDTANDELPPVSELKKQKKAGKPDFNKKKISLDRIDEKKWSLRVGYNYFIPDNKYLTIFQHKLKIGGAYDFNKNFQVQAFLQYADGKSSFNINGVSTQFKGTLYNVGLLAVGLYPVELPLGSIAPFGSIGAAYTFGNLNTSYQNGTESKQNLSGGAILAQAGLQYSYHILSLRVFGEYLYDFTPLNNPYISSLSGFSIGAELGIKF